MAGALQALANAQDQVTLLMRLRQADAEQYGSQLRQYEEELERMRRQQPARVAVPPLRLGGQQQDVGNIASVTDDADDDRENDAEQQSVVVDSDSQSEVTKACSPVR
jgi:hypothetical protein